MPRLAIPTVVARGEAGGTVRGPMASGVDVRGLMAGVDRFAAGADKAREDMEVRRLKLQEDEALSLAQNTLSDGRLKFLQRLEEAKTSAPEGAPGFTAGVMKEFDAWRTQTEAGAPELAKRYMQQQATALREQLNLRAFDFEMGAREKKVVRDFMAGADTDAALVATDPGQLTDVLASRLALGSSLGVSPDAKREMLDGVRKRLAGVAGMRLAETEPGATLKALNDPQAHKVFGLMTGEQLMQVRRAAEQEMQRGSIEVRQALTERVKDVQRMTLDGTPPPANFAPTVEQFAAAGLSADQHRAQVGAYVDIAQDIQALRVSTPQARAQIIDANTPPAGAGYADKRRMQEFLIQAARGVEKQLDEDPAAYASSATPKVAQFRALMNRTLADKAMPPGDKAAAVDLYARTAMAEQERLGAARPRLLVKGEAEAIVQQFTQMKEGGQSSADIVASLEQQWGKWWSTVYGQLASDEKLPPAALVIPNMADRGARARLASLSAMKDADLKAMLPEGEARDVRVALQSKFGDAASSFLTQGPNGASTVATVMGQAEKLALFYKASGKSTGDAAKQAFEETLGHAYTFKKTYRVPNAERPDLVGDGADAALRSVIESVMPFAADPTMKPEDAQRQTMDAVKSSGEWVTSDDERGLSLVARDRVGTVHRVRHPDGRPVFFSWDSLRAIAMDEKSVQGLSAVTGPRPIKKP